MKILFYDTKEYDRASFDRQLPAYPDITIDYLKTDLAPATAKLAKGYDAVCAFVSSDIGTKTIDELHQCGISLILMRCAGFNNVDLKQAAAYGIKVRENDFSLNGLLGFNFHQKTAGIVGTGKIGAAMAKICHGFGMKVLAYDVYHNPELDFAEYVSLDELLKRSDLISLHCPLTDDTYHLINRDTIQKMKDGVILVNTSRGGLVKTQDLVEGIRARKFFGVGLDVYEEETKNVFEDRSDEILENSTTARLLSFPNVMITSHQGFFTQEALAAISQTTLDNAVTFLKGGTTENEVKA